MLNELGIY